MRHRMETRQYDLNLLNVQRSMQRTATNGDATATIATAVTAGDGFAGIEKGVASLLSDRGRVSIDARSGLALVSDFPERLDRVGLYVETLQSRSARQVRLEARAFEVTLRDAPSIDWGAVREKLGLPRNAADAGIAADGRLQQPAVARIDELLLDVSKDEAARLEVRDHLVGEALALEKRHERELHLNDSRLCKRARRAGQHLLLGALHVDLEK